jgi:predicted TIM-barrel fold metal-dependent hydrolase
MNEQMKNTLKVLGVEHDALDFEMPKRACDCHTHVFGPHSDFPLAKSRKYTPPEALLSDLVKLHDGLGIERVVIVHPSPYASDNNCTLMALKALNGRGRGVAVIDQVVSMDQLKSMHQLGVRGVRINLQTEGIHDLNLAKAHIEWTVQKIRSLGWHIQLFTNLNVLSKLGHVFDQSECDFVIDHFGLIDPHLGLSQPGLKELLQRINQGKLWVKLSAPHRISKTPDHKDVTTLAQALISANPNRMVWGSDWPHPGGQPEQRKSMDDIEPFSAINDGAALNRLNHWAQNSQTLEKILSSNPAKLYDF